MPDTAKKRREKLWRWLKISVIVLLLAAGLLRLMISSYAFDLLYLPMASDLIGFKITAACLQALWQTCIPSIIRARPIPTDSISAEISTARISS